MGLAKSAWRLLLAAAVVLSVAPAGQGVQFPGTTAALADDDDGGGDDGGYDGDDDDDRGWRAPVRRQFQPRQQRRPAAVRRAAAPLPERVPNQIVASGLTAEQTARLTAEGFAVVAQAGLGSLGTDVLKLRIPSGMTLEAARDRVQAEAPDAALDFNHYFRPGEALKTCEGRHCLAPSLVGWPLNGAATACAAPAITIGLIDTAINPEHEVFRDGQVEVVRLSDEALPPSGRQHGTAVAALLVGAAESATPGLVPSARLLAVDAFHQDAGKDDRAEAFDLVRALDLMASRDVDVVNMSLSGPPNALVEALVEQLAGKTVLVAAAGNDGPRAKPVYPAAYPGVLAVTAVDRNKRAYRRAGQGEHIDLAAPGVEIWTAASIKGARPKTGTSFAAPFVTAAAALLGASKSGLGAAEIQARLTASAEDLGEPGKDPVFGWGLLNARDVCGGAAGTSP
jgi:subtilisin family serine protease